MAAAAPRLHDEAEIARTMALRQIIVLMRAAGVRVTEEELRPALQYISEDRLVEMPTELADSIDWYRTHAPAELTAAFCAMLEQLHRDAAAGAAPLTEDEIQAEIDAARAERHRGS